MDRWELENKIEKIIEKNCVEIPCRILSSQQLIVSVGELVYPLDLGSRI